MQLSKNAIGNLINRYKAVLKKCHLLNTFGSLALATVLTLGGAQFAQSAAPQSTIEALGDDGIKDILRGIDPGDFDDNGQINQEDKDAWNDHINTLSFEYAHSTVFAKTPEYVEPNPDDPNQVLPDDGYYQVNVKEGDEIIRYGSYSKGVNYATDTTDLVTGGVSMMAHIMTNKEPNVEETKPGYYFKIEGFYYPWGYDENYGDYWEGSHDPKQPGSMLNPENPDYDPTLSSVPDPSTYSFRIRGDANLGAGAINYYVVKDAAGNVIKNTNNASTNPISDIKDNFLGLIGGAIKNNANNTSISIIGDFMNNGEYKKAGLFGGAISNTDGSIIESITGDFINNFAEKGGAIYNDNATIGTINGDFMSNVAMGSGSAIYNTNNAHIGTVRGGFYAISQFYGNSEGSASIIYNNESTIEHIIGVFSDNYIYSVADGALIHNNNAKIYTITSDLYNFTIDLQDHIYGEDSFNGGIYNNNSSIYAITGDIVYYVITAHEDVDFYGGYIHNNNTSTISAFTGNLLYGKIIANSNDTYGGFIYNNNSTFGSITGNVEENLATVNNSNIYGSIIYNGANASMGSITGEFKNNKIENYGGNAYGLIYNTGDSNMGAITGNFTENRIDNYGGNAYGLIYNTGDSNMGVITGEFKDNTIISYAGDAYGLIYNTDASIDGIAGSYENNNISTEDPSGKAHGAVLNNIDSNGTTSIGYISASFLNNSVQAKHGGAAQGGAIWTNTDLNFKAVDEVHTFSDNYTLNLINGAEYKEYNAIYMAADAKTLAFNMEGTGGFVLNDNIKTNNTDTYNLTITGENATNNIFKLNNSLNNAGTVTVTNATLQVGSLTRTDPNPVDPDNIGTVDYSGSIGTANLTIQGGGGLVVQDNIKLDVSDGTLTVASNAAAFSVGANGELIVNASNFGTFGEDGSFDLTGATVNKQLTTTGKLTLTGFSFDSMTQAEKDLLYSDTEFLSLVTDVNNIELDGVAIRNLYYLATITDGTFNEVVMAGETETTINNTASFYQPVAKVSFRLKLHYGH